MKNQKRNQENEKFLKLNLTKLKLANQSKKKTRQNNEEKEDEKIDSTSDEPKVNSRFGRAWKCTKCNLLYLNTNNTQNRCELDGYPQPGSKYDTSQVRNWFKMKKKELKELCIKYKLPYKSGTHPKLVYRLYDYFDKKNNENKPKSLTISKVNKLLKDKYNIKDLEKVSNCIKSGIAKYYINIDKINDINDIIYKEKCDICKNILSVSFKDALYQNDDGTKDKNNKNGAAKCQLNTKCFMIGWYIHGLCEGYTHLAQGRDHKHCHVCKDVTKSMCIVPTNMKGIWFEHCPQCEKRLKKYADVLDDIFTY